MQLDADYQIITTGGKDESSSMLQKPTKGEPIPHEDNPKEPIVRMYGVTKQ